MAQHNVWMSVSDLMTGLMVIFLFVAIAYMIEVNDNQSVLVEYVETRQHVHDKLVEEFAGDTDRWQMTIGKDLSMKFNNPEVLFRSGSAELTPAFCSILDQFIPKYLDILLKDTLSYRIKEIRIEGHTDDLRMAAYGTDAFMSNVKLSQERAYNVLDYIRNMEEYKKFSPEEQTKLNFWFTANGLSYGKSVDSDGKYTAISKKEIDRDKSRRVEFRIVTEGDEVLENFVKKKESLKIL